MWRGILLDKHNKLITVTIIGDSMSPTLYDGDIVTFEYRLNQEYVIGDIILANHPFKRNNIIVKRISKINKSGDYFLEGDNPSIHESSDSRSFGYIKKKYILATLKDK